MNPSIFLFLTNANFVIAHVLPRMLYINITVEITNNEIHHWNKLTYWMLMMFLDFDITEYMRFEDGIWYCLSCDNKTAYKATMRQHIETKHISVAYKCQLCSSSCPTQNALYKHYSRNHKQWNTVLTTVEIVFCFRIHGSLSTRGWHVVLLNLRHHFKISWTHEAAHWDQAYFCNIFVYYVSENTSHKECSL